MAFRVGGIPDKNNKITKIAPKVIGRPTYSSLFNVLNLDNLNNPKITYKNPIGRLSIFSDEIIKTNAGTTPKEIMSDKESRLFPNSAILLLFRARNPSKLSKKIAIKTILAERTKLFIVIK